jgi:hypothetical protein
MFFGTQVGISKELLYWKSMGHFYLSGSRHFAENCMVEGVDAGQYKTTYGVTAVPGRGDGKF